MSPNQTSFSIYTTSGAPVTRRIARQKKTPQNQFLKALDIGYNVDLPRRADDFGASIITMPSEKVPFFQKTVASRLEELELELRPISR